MAQKQKIYISYEGNLINGLFFHFQVFNEGALEHAISSHKKPSFIYAKRKVPDLRPLGAYPLYVESRNTTGKLSPLREAENVCRLGGIKHSVGMWSCGGQRRVLEASTELAGGPMAVETFYYGDDSRFVVTEEFGQRIRKSGLKGLNVIGCPVTNNCSDRVDTPRLSFVQVIGKACLRRYRLAPEENLCPLCKKAPIMCPECGWMPALCTVCFKAYYSEFQYIYEPPDSPAKASRCDDIIEAKDSDGADFFEFHLGYYMISRRALIWLINAGASPFLAFPVWTCVDGISDGQKAEFDEILKTPIPDAPGIIKDVLPKAD